MNEELFQLYVQGLLRDSWFADSSMVDNMPDHLYNILVNLEEKLGRKHGSNRKENPEFQAALKVFNSPLIKALA